MGFQRELKVKKNLLQEEQCSVVQLITKQGSQHWHNTRPTETKESDAQRKSSERDCHSEQNRWTCRGPQKGALPGAMT